jgi:hypothetical protein
MLDDAPIADLVQRICFDLGLTPDWRIWKDLDWGAEYLKARLPEDMGAERWAHLEQAPSATGADRTQHRLESG